MTPMAPELQPLIIWKRLYVQNTHKKYYDMLYFADKIFIWFVFSCKQLITYRQIQHKRTYV